MLQHAAEFDALLNLYRERKPSRVLEIGVFEGGTLFHWLQGVPEVIPEVVVGVDSFTMAHRSLIPVWESWVQAETRLEIIAGQSQNVRHEVEKFGPFDWVFIDADHRYNAVKADWETYRPLCSDVVAFHDILPPSPQHPEIQVHQLWAEIKQDYRTLELIEDPNAAWGGIGVVFLNERTAAWPAT